MIIDTVLGISKYGLLLLAIKIGDIDRFKTSKKLASYAGLVLRSISQVQRNAKDILRKEE